MSCPTDIVSKAYVDNEIKKLREELNQYVKKSDKKWVSDSWIEWLSVIGVSLTAFLALFQIAQIIGGIKGAKGLTDGVGDWFKWKGKNGPNIDKIPDIDSKLGKQAQKLDNILFDISNDQKTIEQLNRLYNQSNGDINNIKNQLEKTFNIANEANGKVTTLEKTLPKEFQNIKSELSTKILQTQETLNKNLRAYAEALAKEGKTQAEIAEKLAKQGIKDASTANEIAKSALKNVGELGDEVKGIKGILKGVQEGSAKALGKAIQALGIASSAMDLIWNLINQGYLESLSNQVVNLENSLQRELQFLSNQLARQGSKIKGIENFINTTITKLTNKFGKIDSIESGLTNLTNQVGKIREDLADTMKRIDFTNIQNARQDLQIQQNTIDTQKAFNQANLAMNFANLALTGLTAFAWVNSLKGIPNQVFANTQNIAKNSNRIDDLTNQLAPLKPLHNPNHPHMNPQGGTMVTERIIEKQPIIYNNYITKPTQVINKEKVVTVPTPAWQPIPNLQPKEVRSYIPVVTERVVTVPQQVPVVTEKVKEVRSYIPVVSQQIDPTLRPIVTNIQNQTNVISGQVTSINAKTTANLAVSNANNSLLGLLNAKTTAMSTTLTTFVTTTWTKFINSRLVDKAINAMNLALNIHNAAMLSRDLGDTFLYMLSNVLSAIGIKDDDGNPYDIASLIGNTVENIIVSVVGQEVWNNTSKQFNSLNRIYQSGMNVIYTVSNIVDSSRNILETVGEYVGKIGNALRRSGEVAENAYQPMQEKFDNISNNRFEKFFDKVENFEEKVSAVDMVASDVISIQDSVNEFQANKAQFKADIRQYQTNQTNINESEPMDYPQSLKDLEDEAKLNSEAPINLEDARF